METIIWYSIRNGGDGSAFPIFFESKELAEIDQEYLDEGWGESCVGPLMITSDGPISIKPFMTQEDYIKEIEEELEYAESGKLREKLQKVIDLY